MSNKVWIVDTSVLCNILSVPHKNQNKEQVIADFRERIQNDDSFLLPYTVIVETGNHIGQANGDRYALAERFVSLVDQSIDGNAPWKTMKVPSKEKVKEWIVGFPDNAARTKGYGDHSIIKEWQEYSDTHKGLSVSIWTLDSDLVGYNSN
ncbi:hypothetical protein EYV94_10775 [Puteibacter caeruleilacunae]|nr:hypothetical protein EYV94_10775 [Puteibacter caeruleilacunae]